MPPSPTANRLNSVSDDTRMVSSSYAFVLSTERAARTGSSRNAWILDNLSGYGSLAKPSIQRLSSKPIEPTAAPPASAWTPSPQAVRHLQNGVERILFPELQSEPLREILKDMLRDQPPSPRSSCHRRSRPRYSWDRRLSCLLPRP